MSLVHFPDPRTFPPDDVLAVGGELTTELLYEAYSHGIFPWPQDGLPMLWFCPVQRGVLDFADFHVSKRLQKLARKKPYRITWNQAFERVIHECQKQFRPGQDGTWITDEMVEAYTQFHRDGHAHSVECWDGDDLAGGLYGVFVKGVFSGESLFFLKPDGSKLALIAAVEELKSQGFEWIDTQMVTPFTEQFGGRYILRNEYLDRLERAQKKQMDFRIPRLT